ATFHLWLKPAGPAYEVLGGAIRELAQELGAPVFEPHVTLLGHLEGTELDHARRTEQLGRELRPFPIVLTEASHGDTYFQCLFMTVQPSAVVMDAHVLARRVFHRTEVDYMPHLSLVYGRYPEGRRREIIARLPAAVRTSFGVNAVHLIKAESQDPRDWHEVLRVAFAARRP
ncbi:MAG TPA: 2'-5' RNA ligase family protein, partial [Methylomirabilota bacterium]|nr:2'-5' RNA ligase family protein [Methylomirabilota bacterium]